MRLIAWRFWILVVMAWTAAAHAQEPAAEQIRVAPPGGWVKSREFSPRPRMKDTPSGQDFLLLDQQINVRDAATYHRRVYQIVSEAGRAGGAQVFVNFDPSYQTLVLHHLRLIRDGRASDRLDPAKIQVLRQERDLDRQLYNGQRSALIILDDVRIGDTLDLAYTVAGRNPVFADKFVDVVPLGWAVPVREEYCRLLAPPERKILAQVQGPDPTAVRTAEVDGLRETEWVAGEQEAIELEARTPASTVVYPFLVLTEFASWADVAHWAAPLYDTPSSSCPDVAALARRLSARGLPPERLIIAALDYVQQEVRYLGIEMGPGSHQPSEPDEVLRRRFGDCKDKARLLATLLQNLGFNARAVLVHSSRHDNLETWLPSPYAFDHVIVAVLTEDNDYLLDPTLTYQRGNRLALRDVGRYGPYLTVTRGITDLLDAAPQRADLSRTSILEEFSAPAFDQPAKLTVRSRYEGASADAVRAYFALTSREQIDRNYLDFYTRYYPSLTGVARPELKDDPDNNVLLVTERYEIRHLFQTAPGSTVQKAEFYPAVLTDYLRVPNFSQRRQPYALPYPTEIATRTLVHLPGEWQVEPANQIIEDPAFVFRRKVGGGGRELELSYEWSSHARQVDVGRLAQFGDRMNRAIAQVGYQLTWNPESATFSPNGYMIGWSLVLVAALAWVSVRLIRRTNPHPPEPPPPAAPPRDPYLHWTRPSAAPEGLGGWLVLVSVGLLVRPIMLVVTIVQGWRSYFDLRVWHVLATPGSDRYRPAWAWVLPLELTVNLVLLILALAMILLFFRRSHLFPRLMQVTLCAYVAVAFYNAVVLTGTGLIPDAASGQGWTRVFQSIVVAAIWVPYFSVSRRVQRTFVR